MKQPSNKQAALNGRTATGAETLQKKPYSAPVLIEYGTIAKLTQGNNTTGNDPGFGNARKNTQCL